METLTTSLSFDKQSVLFQVTSLSSRPLLQEFGETVSLSSISEFLSGHLLPNEENIEETENGALKPHPFILSDRKKAEDIMDQLIQDAELLYQQLVGTSENDIVCPYEKTIAEYLGTDFIIPTVHDLTVPENFCPLEAIKTIVTIDRKYHDLTLTHLQTITAEAADTGFVGVTSQNLGNAFALLSTTPEGTQQYVLDKPRIGEHLSFAELIRTIPNEDIINNPVEIAHKLVSKFIQIHK